jgi:hypothetical protein
MQHGIRISYGDNPADHSAYVVYVPLEGDFPKALQRAVAKAGALLLRSVANDIFPFEAEFPPDSVFQVERPQ